MPGALDALKKLVWNEKAAADIELPLRPGKKQDARLPKPTKLHEGFRVLRETLKQEKK